MTSDLIHCVYASSAARNFETGELAGILELARANNARLGLTGMLLYAEGSFFQVLEGPADLVDKLYASIERDPRHDQVTLIMREPIPRRAFDTWSMGFHQVSLAELAGMSGGERFLRRRPSHRPRGTPAAPGNCWPPSGTVAGARSPPALTPRSTPEMLPSYSYAYQPIVDIVEHRIFSYEALIRGQANEPAFRVLERVPPALKYQFDEDSRVAAIELAVRLGVDCHLNLNLLPQGLSASDTSIMSTMDAAQRHALPIERLILEVTEGEVIADYAQLGRQLNAYRSLGLKVAIDDFGAGYSGLNMLADFQPDQIKIDMNLVRGIERHGPRQAIVRAVVQVCNDLAIDVIAEGVETTAEYAWFVESGVRLFQGYLFAKPGFESLPAAHFPDGA